MSKVDDLTEMAELIEKARALGPMTDSQRREQAASFAFGNLALTREWADRSSPELEELRELCRRMAGCVPAPARGARMLFNGLRCVVVSASRGQVHAVFENGSGEVRADGGLFTPDGE